MGLFKDIDIDKEQCEKLNAYLRQFGLAIDFKIIQGKYVGKIELFRMITIARTTLTTERVEREVKNALTEIAQKAQRILAEISKPSSI